MHPPSFPSQRPLADILRPSSLNEIVGQDHLCKQGPLESMIRNKNLTSFILWGPAGTGKTSMARLLATQSGLVFEQISAVLSGVSQLRAIFEAAKIRQANNERTLLFVDEIHRFNRTQQDSFLPYIEDGTIILIGATTQNPSFELNSALLSRMQVFVLNPLDKEALLLLLERAQVYCQQDLDLSENAQNALCVMAAGDGRYFLGLVEQLFGQYKDQKTRWQEPLSVNAMAERLQKRHASHDKQGDQHYNLISVLHKAVRGSDVDAALYWLARLLVGGEDPLYITRRLIRMATEDIGLASPQALMQAQLADQTFRILGAPEGELALAQAVVYLASAPKSNAVYSAFKAARAYAQHTHDKPPPPHSLNAPTKLMKTLGYGKGYIYDPDTQDGFSGLDYFPKDSKRQTFYTPSNKRLEKEIGTRLEYWEKLRAQKNQPKPHT